MGRFNKTDTPGILLGPDGKEYHNVWKRVYDFREGHPIAEGWSIVTEVVKYEGLDALCFRGQVWKEGGTRPVGVGHSDPLPANLRQHEFKKYETVSIGRACASCGFVSEGSYASADEMEDVDLSPHTPTRAPERTEKPSHKEDLQYEASEPEERSEMGTDCPLCSGPMWDNRPDKENGSKKSTYPDLKCRDRECGKVIWLN